MDNAVVTMASTDVGTETVNTVKRKSQKHKKTHKCYSLKADCSIQPVYG